MRFSKSLKGPGSNPTLSPFQLAATEYTVARRKMVEEQLKPRGIQDPRVLEVMQKIPRHWFVQDALVPQAYNDSPLNIGHGQTISQPYTVALLAQSLFLKGDEEILEIGTGCGYQTAVLSSLAKKIYSIERLSPLLMMARNHLKRLELKNVILKLGDGSLGWPERAPFDAIVAAAVSPEVPMPLLQQLKLGGRLVLPIQRGSKQYLISYQRLEAGYQEQVIQECRFVKMVGSHAFGK
ncbi:MAG: protein-L-isoaspartate(D-aspartate) O-methyltransferase [Deltaproteobacteria bacterium]|nr:protein-L-isoaspartate(D-aspartate) O-methyltransferase [Deltaproteobacteria bacterium]